MAKSGKTRKAVTKRFKKTANGKLKFSSPGRRHLATAKSRKRKRRLKQKNICAKGDEQRLMASITGG